MSDPSPVTPLAKVSLLAGDGSFFFMQGKKGPTMSEETIQELEAKLAALKSTASGATEKLAEAVKPTEPAAEPTHRAKQAAAWSNAMSTGKEWPAWAIVPVGETRPQRTIVACMQFEALWTKDPSLGDRHCVCWPLSDGDEKLAQTRAMGDSNRYINELAKQMVRWIDGEVADFSGGPGRNNIDRFWDDIGPKCRTLMTQMWTQLNSLSQAERIAFFEKHFALVVPGG
jgi:hypothetical protein